MTTDRDTLREKLIEIEFPDGLIDPDESALYRTIRASQEKRLDRIMQLIDAHDNAMKEQTEADILGRLPASSRTCTCMTCRVVTGKLNQVFSRGETDE